MLFTVKGDYFRCIEVLKKTKDKNNDHDKWFYYEINIRMPLMFQYDFGNIISTSRSN